MFVTIKNKDLLRIYLTPLLQMFIIAASGTVSILFALELGADIFQINLITTIRSSMQILLQVPFGILSDRYGRKPMLIRSNLMQILGTLIYVFATEPIHLIYASVMGGFAGGEFFPIMQSMIGDKTEPHQRQEAMSLMYIFSSIGMLSGPIVFSSILTLPQISLRNIYQIILVAQIAFLIYVAMQLSETKPKVSEGNKQSYSLLVKNLLTQPRFLAIAMVGFLFWFFRMTFTTYIKIYARVDLNLSNAEVASFDIFNNLSTFLIRFLSATLLTRVPFRPAIIAFMAVAGGTGLLATIANNYLFIVVLFFLEGISYGATRIMQNVLVANVSTPENRGVANSVNQLFQSAANFSRIFTTPLVDTMGFSPVFILASSAAFIAALIPIVRNKDFEAKQ